MINMPWKIRNLYYTWRNFADKIGFHKWERYYKSNVDQIKTNTYHSYEIRRECKLCKVIEYPRDTFRLYKAKYPLTKR